MRVGIYILFLLPAGFFFAGCTAVSFRPANTFRTVMGIHLGSPEDTPEEIEATFDEYTRSCSIPGNRVVILQNGDKAFPQMIAAIDAARFRVGLATYDLRSDDTGRMFAEAIQRAVRRRVEVRIIFDTIGSRNREPDIFAPLREEGAQIRAFNPSNNWTILRFNNRCHRKILVVDGCTAFMGGLNIGDPYAGNGVNGWRDLAMRVDGPAAAATEKVFAQTWNQAGTNILGKDPSLVGCRWLARGPLLPLINLLKTEFTPPPYSPVESFFCREGGGSARVRVVEQSPDSIESHILNLHLIAINSAKRYVYVASPYFIPPESLIRALLAAAKRGVDVRILTQDQTDEKRVRSLSRFCFPELVAGGVKIYGRESSILHAKLIVVDDRWCSVGSSNLDGRALFMNYEANFAVDDSVVAQQLSQDFLKDIVDSRQYTLEESQRMCDFWRFFWGPFRGQF